MKTKTLRYFIYLWLKSILSKLRLYRMAMSQRFLTVVTGMAQRFERHRRDMRLMPTEHPDDPTVE